MNVPTNSPTTAMKLFRAVSAACVIGSEARFGAVIEPVLPLLSSCLRDDKRCRMGNFDVNDAFLDAIVAALSLWSANN